MRALLQRFDEINEKFAQDISPEEMEKVLEEQARVQDRIEAAGAWELDSKLEAVQVQLALLREIDAKLDGLLDLVHHPVRRVGAAARRRIFE